MSWFSKAVKSATKSASKSVDSARQSATRGVDRVASNIKGAGRTITGGKQSHLLPTTWGDFADPGGVLTNWWHKQVLKDKEAEDDPPPEAFNNLSSLRADTDIRFGDHTGYGGAGGGSGGSGGSGTAGVQGIKALDNMKYGSTRYE